jgi:hypothetical protein
VKTVASADANVALLNALRSITFLDAQNPERGHSWLALVLESSVLSIEFTPKTIKPLFDRTLGTDHDICAGYFEPSAI